MKKIWVLLLVLLILTGCRKTEYYEDTMPVPDTTAQQTETTAPEPETTMAETVPVQPMRYMLPEDLPVPPMIVPFSSRISIVCR